jgi:hypothetical protein
MQRAYRNPAPTGLRSGGESIEVGRTPHVTMDRSPGRYDQVWNDLGAPPLQLGEARVKGAKEAAHRPAGLMDTSASSGRLPSGLRPSC